MVVASCTSALSVSLNVWGGFCFSLPTLEITPYLSQLSVCVFIIIQHTILTTERPGQSRRPGVCHSVTATPMKNITQPAPWWCCTFISCPSDQIVWSRINIRNGNILYVWGKRDAFDWAAERWLRITPGCSRSVKWHNFSVCYLQSVIYQVFILWSSYLKSFTSSLPWG